MTFFTRMRDWFKRPRAASHCPASYYAEECPNIGPDGHCGECEKIIDKNR